MSENTERRRHSARRFGDDFQDMVGVEQLLRLLSELESAEWVTFELDEAWFLDDVVTKTAKGLECYQVKYAVNPDQEWSLQYLTRSARKRGTSPIRKWAISWDKLRQIGTPFTMTVVTDRVPSDELRAVLSESLDGIDNAFLQSETLPNALVQLIQATELSASDATAFLGALHFDFQRPMLKDLEAQLYGRFKQLGTSEEGWFRLKDAVRTWALFKRPSPDGKIRAGDVRDAAGLWNPYRREISQEFRGDQKVYIFNQQLFDELAPPRNAFEAGRYMTLTGSPGAGKSSFLADFASRLESACDWVDCVARHHCYIHPDDRGWETRLSSGVAARDLLRQLRTKYAADLEASDAVAELHRENPTLSDLALWIRECAAIAHERKGCLVLVLDGLDHAYDERGKDELSTLLRALPVPAPPGLYCILGSQPRDALLPSRLGHAISREHKCKGFDIRGIQTYARQCLQGEPSASLVDALQSASQGNPLYLHYVLEQASHTANPDEEWVASLPPYGGHIKSYYETLWERLTSSGRLLAVSLAELAFELPPSEVAPLLRHLGHPAGEALSAPAEICHLLDPNGEGLRLYHSSFRSFVNDHTDAQRLRPGILEAIIAWIEQRGGSRLKWRYLWEFQQRAGDAGPLIDGTSREWAVQSLAALRSPQDIQAILTAAAEAAIDEGRLTDAFHKAWLLRQLLDIVEYDDGSEGLRRLRQAHFDMMGTRALDDTEEAVACWGVRSLLPIARHAACAGSSAVAKEIFKRVVEVANSLPNHSLDDVQHVYVAAAYAGRRIERVVEHYVERGSRSAEDRVLIRAIARSLGEVHRWTDLEALHRDERLTAHECRSVAHELCKIRLAAGPDGVDPALRQMLTSTPSWFGAVVCSVGGVDDVDTTGLEAVPSDLGAEPPRYGETAAWEEKLDEMFWCGVHLAITDRLAELADAKSALEADHRHRARVARAALDCGVECAALLRGGQANIPRMCSFADEILWPLDWPHEEWEFRGVFSRAWQLWLGLCLCLAPSPLVEGAIDLANLRKLWGAHGTTQSKLSLFESACRRGLITAKDRRGFLEWAWEQVRGWREYFPERADAIGQLACTAARVGESKLAEQLCERAASSLFAYGYRKDTTLHMTLDLVQALHGHLPGATPGWLCRMAPWVKATQDTTDGSETNHLPELIWEAIQQVDQGRAAPYLLDCVQDRRWHTVRACTGQFVSANIRDPWARALGRTLSDDNDLRCFREAWEAWIEGSCPLQDSDDERARTKRWESITEVAEARPRGDQKGDDTPWARDTSGADSLDSPRAVLDAVVARSLPRCGDEEYWSRKCAGWFGPESPTGNIDVLQELAAEWIGWGRDRDHELTDALWRITLAAGLRDLTFDLLVLAQRQSRGWAAYWSAPEAAQRRQAVIVAQFPERAVEFVEESLLPWLVDYGAGEPSRVAPFLAQARRLDLAMDLGEERVRQIELMFPEYDPPPCSWASAERAEQSAKEVLLSRLHHPEVYVRTRAAEELAELILAEMDGAIEGVLGFLKRQTSDTAAVSGLLALLLAEAGGYRFTTERLSAIRQMAEGKGPMSAYLVSELTTASSDEEPHQAQGPSIGESLDPAPSWFRDFIETSEPFALWYRRSALSAKDEWLAAWFTEASGRGVSRSTIGRMSEEDRYVRTHDRTFTPHESKLSEAMRDGLTAAAVRLHNAGIIGADEAGRCVRGAVPVDPCHSARFVQPRPDWVPPPVELEHEHWKILPAHAPLEWYTLLPRVGSEHGQVLACELGVRHAATAESATVLPFLYSVEDTGVPRAEDVYQYLTEFACTAREAGIWESRLPAEQLLAKGDELPVLIGGIAVYPVVAMFMPRLRRWQALSGYFHSFRLLQGTPVSRSLSLSWEGSWSYREGETLCVHAYYWQSEGARELHRDLGMTGGFVMEASADWMRTIAQRTGLQWGCVRCTRLSHVGKRGDEETTHAAEYHLHGVSRILRA